MSIFFMPSFIDDIKEFDDPNFGKRVFNQIFGSRCEFRQGQDDHRYHGIEDAWIRYISKGRTGYRLIYIRKNDDVYLYRVGDHAVEDNLSKPSDLSEDISVNSKQITASRGPASIYEDSGLLLQNTHPTLLRTVVGSLFHVGHHSITLISPFYSEHLFSGFHSFGSFLNKSIEEGTYIYFVTLPPKDNNFSFFDDLEARGIFVYFYKTLHSKLYLFDINEGTLNRYNRSEIKKTAILGSSNLTENGFAFEGNVFNEELCYRVPESKFFDFQQYSESLIRHSEDLTSFKMRTRRF